MEKPNDNEERTDSPADEIEAELKAELDAAGETADAQDPVLEDAPPSLMDTVMGHFLEDWQDRSEKFDELADAVRDSANGIMLGSLGNFAKALEDKGLPEELSLSDASIEELAPMRETMRNETLSRLVGLIQDLARLAGAEELLPVGCSVSKLSGKTTSGAVVLVRANQEGRTRIKVGDAVYPEDAVDPLLARLLGKELVELSDVEVRVGEGDDSFVVSSSGHDSCVRLLARVYGNSVEAPWLARWDAEVGVCQMALAEARASAAEPREVGISLMSGGISAVKEDTREGGIWLRQFTFHAGEIKSLFAGFDSDGAQVGDQDVETVDIVGMAETLVSLKADGAWKLSVDDNAIYRHLAGEANQQSRVVMGVGGADGEEILVYEGVGELVVAIAEAARASETRRDGDLVESLSALRKTIKGTLEELEEIHEPSKFAELAPSSVSDWKDLGKAKKKDKNKEALSLVKDGDVPSEGSMGGDSKALLAGLKRKLEARK